MIARYLSDIELKKFNDMKYDEIIQFNNESIHCVMNIDGIISGKVESIVFFVDKLSDERFYFRNKTLFERLMIKLKLLRMYQSNDTQFNKLVYVASDNKKLYSEIDNANIHSAILDIFSLPYLYDCKSIKIENNEAFKIEFKLEKKYRKKDIDITKFLEQYGNYFLEIYREINQEVFNSKELTTNSVIKKIKFLTVFSAILGFFLFIFEQYIVHPSIVDLIPLQFLTIVFSGLFSIAVGIYIFREIPNSSFKFDLAKKYSFFAFFASFTIFMMIIKYLNIWGDDSSIEVVQDTIKGKRYSTRAPLKKHFDLANHYNKIDTYEIRVDSDVYDKKQIEDTATIYVKQGNFNIRWIEKVE